MKFAFMLFLAAMVGARAQTPAPAPSEAASEQTLQYIHASWDQLTRSATACAALADVKVHATPVLYVPADEPIPAEAAAAAKRCHAQVLVLPRRIEKLGDVMPQELPVPGLLYLPNPYVVPGGRFNEMYGWDSFFILLGLEADHHEALKIVLVGNEIAVPGDDVERRMVHFRRPEIALEFGDHGASRAFVFVSGNGR